MRELEPEVQAIGAELGALSAGDTSAIAAVMPAVRELLDGDFAIFYSVVPTVAGLRIARFEGDRAPANLRALMTSMFERSSASLFYDAIRPAVDQRNRALEATAWIDRNAPGTWASSTFCTEVVEKIGRARDRQLRVLICDGPALLGWLGVMLPAMPTRRQLGHLQALVPAVHRRLVLERRLGAEPRGLATLIAALNQLAGAAFVLGAHGEIHEMNDAGRAVLAERRAEICGALADACAGRPATPAVELVPIRERGVPALWLAILRENAVATRVDVAARRAGLTPRQRAVLERIAQGHTTSRIAAELGIGERAVELHITALFSRLGVDNRAALVARVLGGAG